MAWRKIYGAPGMIPFLERYAYGAIFAAVLLDTVGLPIPGEVFLLAAGFAVSTGSTEWLPVVLAGAVGAVVGDSLTFWLGRRVGFRGERRLVAVYCKWTACTLGSSYCIERAEGLVRRLRGWVIIIAKFVPGARTFVPPMAGAAALSYRRFLVLDTLGSILWSGVVVSLGGLAGREWANVSRGLGHASSFVALTLAAILGAYTLWKIARRRRFGAPPRMVTASIEENPIA